MAEMVDGQRHIVADHIPDLPDVVFQHIQSMLGQMNAGEGVGGMYQIVAFLVAHHVRRDGTALHVQNVRRITLHVVQKAQRRGQGPGLVHQKTNAQIHLEKSEAHVQPLFQGKAHIVAGMAALHVRIAVHANLVPEFAAQQLVQGHAIGLASQIP